MSEKRKKKAKKSDPSLVELVEKAARAKIAGLVNYKRADRYIQQIAALVKPGEEIILNESGKKAVLKDKFKDNDIVWTPSAARRYELEIIEP